MKKHIDDLGVKIGGGLYVIFSSILYLVLIVISFLIAIPVKIYRGLYERFLATKS